MNYRTVKACLIPSVPELPGARATCRRIHSSEDHIRQWAALTRERAVKITGDTGTLIAWLESGLLLDESQDLDMEF